MGFFNFNAQTDRVKLWIPAGSVTRENSFWLNSNYPPDVRYQSAIVKVIISKKFFEDHIRVIIFEEKGEYIVQFHCDFNLQRTRRGFIKRVFMK